MSTARDPVWTPLSRSHQVMADTRNGKELHPATAELAAGANFATIATVFPDGHLQAHVVWVGLRDGQIVVNTEVHRAKHRNLQEDPRVTVLIRDEANPYRYAEVRGEVTRTTVGPEARAHIDELSRKYNEQDYPPGDIKSERVILWVTPHRQTVVDQKNDVGTED
jgi:PPOX class probable F420-dependent enzyme